MFMKKSKSLHFIVLLFSLYSFSLQSCSKYTVTTSQRDPADVAYKKKVMASYLWGIINNPHRTVDTACGSAGLDEVKITTNVGYSVINVVTLGIVHVVQVEWKCQKEPPVIGFQP